MASGSLCIHHSQQWPLTVESNMQSVRESWELKVCMYKTISSHGGYIPWGEYPFCLQTTAASVSSQDSSHTVPHVLLMHTSTLPIVGFLSPVIRTAPSKQRSGEWVHTLINNHESELVVWNNKSEKSVHLHIPHQLLQMENSAKCHSHSCCTQE